MPAPALVAVRAGHDTGPVNLALPPGGAISGRITIQGSSAPARGVCVAASNADPLNGETGVTGAGGRYRITALAAGSYKMTVMTTGGCQSRGEDLGPASLPGRVRVTAGHSTSGVNASGGQGGSMAGRVTGPGGHGEPGMCVEVFAHPGGLVSSAATGWHGWYKIAGLAPGRYDVLLGDPSCSVGPAGLASQWYNDAPPRTRRQL